ncbi:MAG: helix-turn-helix domain-containing protein [Shimia sp.]|nr:helix-turn-helix domain-containing protein [Shimia sp.]
MISPEGRQQALDLIHEAVAAGARQDRACAILEITARTLRRWEKQLSEEQALADRRPAAARERTPSNKLTDAEKTQIITLCNQPEYQSLPPSQIVPKLADQGHYIASESSFYRVLHEAEQLNHYGLKVHRLRTKVRPVD